MYKKKKKNKKKLIILGIVFIIVIVSLIVNIFKNERNLNIIEKSVKDSVLFVQKIINAPVNFVKEKIEDYKDKKEMLTKYQELEKNIEEINQTLAENEELKKQLQELQETLDLNNSLNEKTYLNATVINRDLGYWYDTITIDKGTTSGVELNMAVVVKNGLIGKVTKVSNFNSTVKLLTSSDVNNKISVKIKLSDKKYVYGLLVGYDKEKETYKIEGIAENIEIPIDAIVTTTGLGDAFPSGIVIGNVSGVTTDNFDLAKIVEVKSDIDFNDISYVTVLQRKVDSE